MRQKDRCRFLSPSHRQICSFASSLAGRARHMPRPSRQAGTPQGEVRRLTCVAWTLFLVLLTATTSAVSGQTAADGSTTGDSADATFEDDIPPPVPKVEVQAYFTEFTRQGPYPFQVCAELPGEIGDPLLILTARSARCIPVEQGELEFCVGVGYDVCSRVVSPSVYDESLQLQFEEHTARHTLEWPDLATTECFDAFKTYICLLGFPRCEENKETPGVYFELPLCYDYCVASHVSCAASLVRMLRPEGRIPGGLLPPLFT
jgi:hypothetical protein